MQTCAVRAVCVCVRVCVCARARACVHAVGVSATGASCRTPLRLPVAMCSCRICPLLMVSSGGRGAVMGRVPLTSACSKTALQRPRPPVRLAGLGSRVWGRTAQPSRVSMHQPILGPIPSFLLFHQSSRQCGGMLMPAQIFEPRVMTHQPNN